jgi:hypothetical protein
MKKKIIGICICMLFITTTAMPVFGNMVSNKTIGGKNQGNTNEKNINPIPASRDGWDLQWSKNYGGYGHSSMPQPCGDIDGDGINEVIVGGYETPVNGKCRILSYDSNQMTYIEEYSWSVTGGDYNAPDGACIADLNKDGSLILCVAWFNSSADGIYAYKWDGTTLTTLDWYHGEGVDHGTWDVYACDYNDDGNIEVLVANGPKYGTSDKHVIALGWDTVNQKFYYETSWACPGGTSMECPMVWSGDVDNDGLTEVIADVSDYQSATAGTWALNWNNNTQSWDAVPVWTNYGSATVYGDCVGDIDGDGTPEIGIGSAGGTPQGWLFEWDGSAYQQVWNGQYPGGKPVIESVAIGDADNDGHNEFCFGTGYVHIIGWNGTGYYEKATLTEPKGMLAGMNIGDFDTDGVNELKACEILSPPNGNEFIYKYYYTNRPPSAPTITGPAKGKVGVATEYNFTTTDPDGDEVSYFIDWGDGTNSSWIGPYSSGELINESHTWSKKGTYIIKAKAKDSYGAESDWKTFSVKMPTAYNIPYLPFLVRFFERFPHSFPILRHLLGY